MVDNVIVWRIIEENLSKLKHSIEKLMEWTASNKSINWTFNGSILQSWA
jgi:hypothetical protein